MDNNYMTEDELSTIFEILSTLNEMSDDAQSMFDTFNLYDVNGDPICSIQWKEGKFALALALEAE